MCIDIRGGTGEVERVATKREHLQIRVTADQKSALQARAHAVGMDMSAYVLDRALPSRPQRARDLVAAMRTGDHRYALAEFNDLLTGCPAVEFEEMAREAAPMALDLYLQNYVAALVEQAAALKYVPPPAWTTRVPPLEAPHFVTPLRSLRLHLLRSAPVPFKRRNLFVDSAIGARV
jgi:uncharacterized protein (DUF1778 family)